MGELGALFNPGMRHELEERQAKAARREEEGNANDGDLRIDLESGVAVIKSEGQQDISGELADAAAPAVDAEVAPKASSERPASRSAAKIRDDGEATPGAPATAPQAPIPAATTPAHASARTSQAVKAGLVVRPRGKRGASAGR